MRRRYSGFYLDIILRPNHGCGQRANGLLRVRIASSGDWMPSIVGYGSSDCFLFGQRLQEGKLLKNSFKMVHFERCRVRVVT